MVPLLFVFQLTDVTQQNSYYSFDIVSGKQVHLNRQFAAMTNTKQGADPGLSKEGGGAP